jgi:predicted RNA methylase
MSGDIYEKLLKDLQSAGNTGEFYTPRAVTQFIVDQVHPRLGETILDPACGTGSFLVCTIEHLHRQAKTEADERTIQTCFAGIEKKHLPHILCMTNLLLHGTDAPSNVLHDNTLSRPLRDWSPKERVDVIVTNPPFGGMEEGGIQANLPSEFRTRETADLFLVLLMKILKPGGRAGLVLPDGTLFGEGVKTRIKEALLAECNLHTIVRLPNGVFNPYTGIRTNLLFFTKGAPTTGVWYYEHPYPPGAKTYNKGKPIRIEEFEGERGWWGSDELMALCDRLEAQQNERKTRQAALARASLARFADAPSPANLNLLFHKSYSIPPGELRKSILELAVRGMLAAQDPNDEPAEALLKRVDSDRERLVKARRIRRQDFLGPIEEDAVPFGVPDSWQWRYLADVCFLITDGAHHTPQYQASGVPFLSVKDVSSGIIDFSNTRYISSNAHRELCKRCRPEHGDILLTKVGTTWITVTIDDTRPYSIFVSLALLKFSQSNLSRQYLKHLINSPFVRQQSAENTQGIGNKNLVLRLINRFTVSIPPLAEQRRIVAKVDQLMALVDELEAQIAASRTTGARLLEAVVAELTANN